MQYWPLGLDPSIPVRIHFKNKTNLTHMQQPRLDFSDLDISVIKK